jgi:protein tyrosine phosphatase (PTP) superfamily phosphohydrolase (DUF442 family)
MGADATLASRSAALRSLPAGLLLIAAALAGCSARQTHDVPAGAADMEPASESPGSKPATKARQPKPRAVAVPIPQFAEVTEGVYRGAQPDHAGFRALAKLGVRTVVNLRTNHSDSELIGSAPLEEVRIRMRADLFGSRPPTLEEVRAFLDIVTSEERKPVFVHCAAGSDRTGVMIAIYRIEVCEWSRRDAIAEMEAMGFHSNYGELAQFVREYRVTGEWRKRFVTLLPPTRPRREPPAPVSVSVAASTASRPIQK